MDHKAEFILLTIKTLGQQAADLIEWSNPRLLCIAGDFTKYDEHAVQQINRNIELIRYREFEEGLLLFELVNATSPQTVYEVGKPSVKKTKTQQAHRTVVENLSQAPEGLRDVFDSLKVFLEALGDDVQLITNKYYFAFKRLKNFACVEIYAKAKRIIVYVKVDPTTISLEEGFTRDVRNIGHYGTGELEIALTSIQDFERAKPLLLRSYESS